MGLRLSLAILCAAGVVFVVSGCAPTKPAETYVPNYDFAPPESAPVASADVSFAIVLPAYEVTDEWEKYWTAQWPFDQITKNMALDFQELLPAKGFTTRGPYRSFDEMTFPDKKGTDLLLVPRLDMDLTFSTMKVTEEGMVIVAGPATISGRVSLSVNESLTNERMWFKSIEIPAKQVELGHYGRRIGSLTDHSFSEPLAKAFEEMYASVMSTAWAYLDAEEMAMVKSQAMEIKKKKTY